MDALAIAVAIISDWPEHQVRSTKSFDVDFIVPSLTQEVGWELFYVNGEWMGAELTDPMPYSLASWMGHP